MHIKERRCRVEFLPEQAMNENLLETETGADKHKIPASYWRSTNHTARSCSALWEIWFQYIASCEGRKSTPFLQAINKEPV